MVFAIQRHVRSKYFSHEICRQRCEAHKKYDINVYGGCTSYCDDDGGDSEMRASVAIHTHCPPHQAHLGTRYICFHLQDISSPRLP